MQMELDPTVIVVHPEAQAIRDRPAKIEPSTAVSPLSASASRPADSGTAWAASSWTIGRSRSASKTCAASERDPRGSAFDAKLLTGFLPIQWPAANAEALQSGIAEVHQQECDVLVIEELPIAGAVAFSTGFMQSRNRFQQRLNQPLPLQGYRRRVSFPIAFRTSLCHSDSSGRTVGLWCKSHAEHYWGRAGVGC